MLVNIKAGGCKLSVSSGDEIFDTYLDLSSGRGSAATPYHELYLLSTHQFIHPYTSQHHIIAGRILHQQFSDEIGTSIDPADVLYRVHPFTVNNDLIRVPERNLPYPYEILRGHIIVELSSIKSTSSTLRFRSTLLGFRKSFLNF